ncbi:uncharacterized protein K452DRAFT_321464 [Aplosporella prunicola CBS 121167]|uniref:SAC domain-containing protein n=1 Tax=Aplosporella prunicola CBS 121167 TaxID=1176127 RepID=A0A6A6B1Q0_9PEZI|nr:uncharacterized protein K452DRAFT_321464 [Aplosporella prunicola CBS 121167]KAF2138109.1 hypothetical protein K452DRAFT_321464 [Aplosporella prunicola CBS 121167]
MPGLVRKLLIFAAADGLILQPAPPRNHPPTTQQAIKIDYTGKIAPLLKDRREEDTTPVSLEAHGIVGLLQVAKANFLVSISERELVAQIRGKPIYTITDVTLIPLASQEEANRAIIQAKESLKRRKGNHDSDDDDESSDDDSDSSSDHITVDESLPTTPPSEAEKDATAATSRKRTSVAQDVIGRKGVYGRFAQKWFSKKGWSAEHRRMQGMSSDEDLPQKQKLKTETPNSEIPKTDAPKAPQDDAEAEPQSMSPSEERKDAAVKPTQELESNLPMPSGNTTSTLLPKILKTTKLYFSSKSFFFSYEYDLSRSLATQNGASTSLPLYRLFDPVFFWNQRIAASFIEAGQHNFVLPLIQGFVGQRAFSVDVSATSSEATVAASASDPREVVAAQDEARRPGSPSSPTKSGLASPQVTNLSVQGSRKKDFLITLISRRSVKRAGLRYLRRGVDEDGNVANSVETEQILSPQSFDSNSGKIYSFVQFRGSIPIFFSQSPYSLKPLPQFHGSPEANYAAFKLHFSKLANKYGGVQVASLVDKHGNEAKIGEEYEFTASLLNERGGIDGKGKGLGFEWFDFHNVCRGMKFENVSMLMDALAPNMTSFGWTAEEHGLLTGTQSGVLRTNCMDCLDRTNVVQSACGRNALEQQLAEQHIGIDLQNDPKTSWFNTLWADNGDAISKQYAGTSALKGDFTRTRKRNITGALTDFGLTLSRYYNNIVNDYFAQAVIDFLLGRATESIFDDFEDDMKAQDYAIDLRKVREMAISRCSELVIEDADEDFIHGWTLSCPAKGNTLRVLPFEECVLLLTEKALYFCRFDWGTEKVREFEKIELENITKLSKGTYITSTLAPRHMDETKNVGFVVEYIQQSDAVRINTRSLANEKSESEAQARAQAEGKTNSETENNKDDSDGAQRESIAEGVTEASKAKAETEGKGTTSEKEKEKTGSQSAPVRRYLAFKALPPKSSFATASGPDDGEQPSEPPSERELVSMICADVQRAAAEVRGQKKGIQKKRASVSEGGEDAEADPLVAIEEREIISLAEAKKSTGYLEQIGYSLKKLVWA